MIDLDAISVHINNVDKHLLDEGYELDFENDVCSSNKKYNKKKIKGNSKSVKIPETPTLKGLSEGTRYPGNKYNTKQGTTVGSPKAEATPDEPVNHKGGYSSEDKIFKKTTSKELGTGQRPKAASQSKGESVTRSPENPAVDGDWLPDMAIDKKKIAAKRRAKEILDEGEGAGLTAHVSTATKEKPKM
jgi:hypothetical protein